MSKDFIQIRPAMASDRQRILEISAQVWEGTDYVPRVLDYWLSAKNGILFVCTLNEAVMGFSRMTFLDSERVWLEGIRVDLAARGKGLGKFMTTALTEESQHRGFKECLLSSYVENYESLGIVRANGYETLGTFKFFVANKEATNREKIQAVLKGSTSLMGKTLLKYEIRPMTAEVTDTLLHRMASGLALSERLPYLSFDWTFEPLSKALISALVDEKALWILHLEFEGEDGVDTLFSLSKRHSKDGGVHMNYIEKTQLSPWVWLIAIEENEQFEHQSFSYMAPTVNKEELRALMIVAKELGLETFNPEDEDVFLFSKKGCDGK